MIIFDFVVQVDNFFLTESSILLHQVHDAGHMVSMDQPKAALEMLKRWTQGSITDNNSQILKTVTEMPEKNFES